MFCKLGTETITKYTAMKVTYINDQDSKLTYSFDHKGETFYMIVNTTNIPFRGVAGIDSLQADSYKAKAPSQKVLTDVYSAILEHSVEVL